MPDGCAFSPTLDRPNVSPYAPTMEDRAHKAGITPAMVQAGVEAVHQRWRGLYIGLGGDRIKGLDHSATELAVAAAFQAMEAVGERGPRDTLFHAGHVGGSDPRGWEQIDPRHRAVSILESIPDQVLGAAYTIIGDCTLATTHRMMNPNQATKLCFVANSLIGLARLMQRANAQQRRTSDELQAKLRDERTAHRETREKLAAREQRKAQQVKPKRKRPAAKRVPAAVEGGAA